MAIVSLLVGQGHKGTQIERVVQGSNPIITLDATVRETFDSPTELTQFPVEDGADITDHAILKPQTLVIEGVVTQTPMQGNLAAITQAGGVATTVASQVGRNLGGALGGVIGAGATAKTLAGVLGTSGDSRLRDFIKELENIRIGRVPLNIVTGLKRYVGFMLVSYSATRNQSTGGSIQVTLNLRERLIATSQTGSVMVPANGNALGKVNEGRKNGTPATPEKESSILLDVGRSLGFGG